MPTDEEITALAQRLDEEPRYQLLDVTSLRRGSDITAVARYRTGDLVRVARSDGGWSLGAVCEKTAEGKLRIVVRSRRSGSISFKEQSDATIAGTNPLKIGDYMQIGSTTFWVTGLDADGDIAVVTQSGARVDPLELRSKLDAEIARVVLALENTAVGGPPPTLSPVKKMMIASATTLLDPIPTRPNAAPGARVPIDDVLSGDVRRGVKAE